MEKSTILTQSNNLHSNQYSKAYKDLLILANVDLVFNAIEAMNLDSDELISEGMDAFVSFVNEGNFTKDNFKDEATYFIQNQLSYRNKLQ